MTGYVLCDGSMELQRAKQLVPAAPEAAMPAADAPAHAAVNISDQQQEKQQQDQDQEPKAARPGAHHQEATPYRLSSVSQREQAAQHHSRQDSSSSDQLQQRLQVLYHLRPDWQTARGYDLEVESASELQGHVLVLGGGSSPDALLLALAPLRSSQLRQWRPIVILDQATPAGGSVDQCASSPTVGQAYSTGEGLGGGGGQQCIDAGVSNMHSRVVVGADGDVFVARVLAPLPPPAPSPPARGVHQHLLEMCLELDQPHFVAAGAEQQLVQRTSVQAAAATRIS
jgi:hypothetical protein